MLRSLHVKNYVLIDSLDVDFPEGLVIITGQTGAGKSILLGALALAAGAKADSSIIAQGAENCLVEAEWGDGTIISRVVSRSGRSRCYINDVPASVQEVAELSSRLVDIHSQHQSLLLTDHAFQLSLLDNYAGNAPLLKECRENFSLMNSLKNEIESVRENLARLSSDLDYNLARLRKLEEAKLRDGELEELEEEQSALANAEEIKQNLVCARELISPSGDTAGITASLKEVSRALERAGKYLPSMAALRERVESARIDLEDIGAELDCADSKIDVSESRLETVENRIGEIYDLFKKFSCSNVAELIAYRDSLKESIGDNTNIEEKLSCLQAQYDSARGAYLDICEKLNKSRAAKASEFSNEILSNLHFLEMEKGIFEVSLEPSKETASGNCSAVFKFSASGMTPVDVAKCASGGEISRIMLCLKAMMARFEGMPTMIFDEIDTGVSGSVADKMGSMICNMGSSSQVFAITHLPQVAAKGMAHYLVSKSEEGGKTVSTLTRLDGESRINEIARLLSGSSITDAAIANAKSLLNID